MNKGDVVWVVFPYDNNYEGTVHKAVYVREIPGDYLSDTRHEIILDDKQFTMFDSMVFDHKPKLVIREDDYGEFTVWE